MINVTNAHLPKSRFLTSVLSGLLVVILGGSGALAQTSGITPQLSGGTGHSLALQADGTVWAWGAGSIGQLGNGSQDSSAVPIPVPGMQDVIAVSAGELHSLALKNDGTIWGCVANVVGQLGNGATETPAFVVQASNLNLTLTGLLLSLSQPGGPGTPITLHNGNLMPGHEYFNVFSADICPAGPGTGTPTLLGLCATSMSAIAAQMSLPLGSPPFHFLAPSSFPDWGPIAVYPITVDAVCFDITNHMLLSVSLVVRMSVQ